MIVASQLSPDLFQTHSTGYRRPSDVPRGVASSRTATGDFAYEAQAVVVTSGGIGGNHDLVREAWPARLGRPPEHLISGVPANVDGRMLGITRQAGGR